MDRTPKTNFHVKAVWDSEAEVFVSETDIRGLVVETKTLDEFEEVALDLAPEMIRMNYDKPEGFMPTITLSRLAPAVHA